MVLFLAVGWQVYYLKVSPLVLFIVHCADVPIQSFFEVKRAF
jgi:hypothetical protein